MRLQATAITKGRRLSLGVVKPPATEKKEEPTPQEVNKPPTMEEVAYTELVAKYPKVGELVNRLGLSLAYTPIKKVEITEEYKANRLKEIAEKVASPEKAYSLEEIISLISVEVRVTRERAEIGLALMLEAGAMERSGDLYYLGGSTPF